VPTCLPLLLTLVCQLKSQSTTATDVTKPTKSSIMQDVMSVQQLQTCRSPQDVASCRMSCQYLLLVIQAAVASAVRACAAAVAAEWAASAMVTPAALAALLTGPLATGPLPVQVSLVIVPCFESLMCCCRLSALYSLLLVLAMCLRTVCC